MMTEIQILFLLTGFLMVNVVALIWRCEILSRRIDIAQERISILSAIAQARESLARRSWEAA